MRGLVVLFRSRRPRPFLERQRRLEEAWSRRFIIVDRGRSMLDEDRGADRDPQYEMERVWWFPVTGFPWFEENVPLDQPEGGAS